MLRRRRRRRRLSLGMSRWLIILILGYVALSSLISLARENIAVLLALAGGITLAVYWCIRRWAHRRLRAKTLEELLLLSPTQFEVAVADLLRVLGYRSVKRVGGAGDLAADIVCRDSQGRSVVVQCKRYAPHVSIGSPAIQHFIGMQAIHHRAERGIFVTTSRYSKPAVNLAAQHAIMLVDGEALSRLLLKIHGEVPRSVNVENDLA
jgi:restriction system protein